MAKKPNESAATPETPRGGPAGGNVKDSAQQIWLAGLGAFAKAQEEGTKVFEALVKEGLGMQRKTQQAAEEKLSEATSKMANMAGGFPPRPPGPWDKLENIFEDRVAKALQKLGMPSAQDLAALTGRIDALESQLANLATPSAAAVGAARKRPAGRSATGTARPHAGKTAGG
ncbi:MAG: hypothetical protein JWP29_2103 [Rhodoferax sp.]|nr:hypothetical protein [Rhodoferax sp.]